MQFLFTALLALIFSMLTSAMNPCPIEDDLRCNGHQEIQICSNFSSGMWWVFTYRCPWGYICIDNGCVTGPHCVQVMAPCNPNCGNEEIAAAVEAAYAAHPKAIEAEEEGKKEGEVVASSFVA